MPKSIQAPVGAGGRNLQLDVVTVQYLLNCVPVGKGGPVPELAVDGLVGPKTIQAIRKFQTTAFGRADGRVDPGGRTIKALVAYDPYPNQPVAFSGPGKTSAGSSGKSVPGQKSPPGSPWGKNAPGTPSPWGKNLPGKGGGGGKTGF